MHDWRNYKNCGCGEPGCFSYHWWCRYPEKKEVSIMQLGITKEDVDIVLHALDQLHDIQAGAGLPEADYTFALCIKINDWKKETWG